MEENPLLNFYQHYKYYHFYACCFGIGCGAALYRPYRSLLIPSILGVLFTVVFEVFGIFSGMPPHTKRCKGPPYCKGDIYWGFCFALFVALVNLGSYHASHLVVYTLSYGCGIIVFAVRGAKRKYSSLC
ncbi:uncharacterized protein ACB058_005547 isoform 1-T1 [Synchiropus picturatus]